MRLSRAAKRFGILLSVAFALSAHAVEVPVDIGVGPGAYWFFMPPFTQRGFIPHYALELNAYGVVNRKLILDNIDRVPPQYRGMAENMSELKVRPWWALLIPSTLYISPAVPVFGNAGVYGATWKPFGLGLFDTAREDLMQLQRPVARLHLDATLLITYAYFHSLDDSLLATHFVRPGIELDLEFEWWPADAFGVSFAIAGQGYVPQVVGGFGFGTFDNMITFVAGSRLKLHFRFPLQVEL